MDIYHKSSPDFNNTYSVAWAVLSYAPTDKRSTHISHLSHWPRIKLELPKYTGDDGIRGSTVWCQSARELTLHCVTTPASNERLGRVAETTSQRFRLVRYKGTCQTMG